MRALSRLLSAVFCFFALSVIAPDAHAQTFTFRDAGMERKFELALDEVAVTKSNLIRHVTKIPRAANVSEIRRQSRRVPGEEVDLVLYEISDGKRVGSPLIVTPQVLVEVEAGTDAASRILGLGALQVEFAVNNLYIATASDSAAALDLATQLKSTSGVIAADPLLARKNFKRFTPNDSLFTSQWHLRNTGQTGGTAGNDVRVTNAWDTSRGSNIVIGIMDDGLETAHPDLAANVDTINDWDFNGNDNDPNHTLTGFDEGHGTSCGGVAAAVGNNSIGISGVAPNAKLVGLRINAAAISDSGEAAAMNWSNSIIHIKNNSWGPNDNGSTLGGPGALMEAAMSNACMQGRGGRGVLIFWSCGNGGGNGDNANYDGYANSIYAIAVGSADHNGVHPASFSEPGANVAVCAPADNDSGSVAIWTTDLSGSEGYEPGDYENGFGGTSASAPIAAGVGALVLNANTNLTWRDAKEILIRTATRNNSGDTDWRANAAGIWFNHKFGGGMVNASGAVAMAKTWTNLAPMVRAVTNQAGLSLVILDNNAAGVTRTFNITSAIRVEQVVVNLTASHTFRGNLKVELISPGNTTSVLADVHNDSNDNYSNWRFSTVRNWGESSVGTWTLRVADRVAGDVGSLSTAGLTLFGTDAGLITPMAITSSTSNTDFFAVTNLINGSGLSASPPTLLNLGTHADIAFSNAWVTAANAPYYFTALPAPVLTCTMPQTNVHLLSELVIWGYPTNSNEAKTFVLTFSLDGANYGETVAVTSSVPISSAARRLPFPSAHYARYVRITITSNHYGVGVGGDRVGLGELRLAGQEVPSGTRFVSLTGSHTLPFTNWVTAATNIQAAVDAAFVGENVLVTNGTYQTGGRVVGGTLLTNRVVIDKPIPLQSVNGPAVTIIKGAGPVGNAAIRCVWMTNGSTLVGFTLTNGATRTGVRIRLAAACRHSQLPWWSAVASLSAIPRRTLAVAHTVAR